MAITTERKHDQCPVSFLCPLAAARSDELRHRPARDGFDRGERKVSKMTEERGALQFRQPGAQKHRDGISSAVRRRVARVRARASEYVDDRRSRVVLGGNDKYAQIDVFDHATLNVWLSTRDDQARLRLVRLADRATTELGPGEYSLGHTTWALDLAARDELAGTFAIEVIDATGTAYEVRHTAESVRSRDPEPARSGAPLGGMARIVEVIRADRQHALRIDDAGDQPCRLVALVLQSGSSYRLDALGASGPSAVYAIDDFTGTAITLGDVEEGTALIDLDRIPAVAGSEPNYWSLRLGRQAKNASAIYSNAPDLARPGRAIRIPAYIEDGTPAIRRKPFFTSSGILKVKVSELEEAHLA